MSLDRLVTWTHEDGPTIHHLAMLVEDFLGGAGDVRVDHDKDALAATLHGKTSDPFKRVTGPYNATIRVGIPRTIHVAIDKRQATVVTHDQDPFTNALAGQLARTIAARWKGKVG